MDKRYTVFVSSTFKDLVDARWAVARALMRLNLIPLGMENFTASDKGQWEIIKKTIDLSDYYVLILGNCYGSIDPETGISYTEKEYRYALGQGIPCLTFVSKDVPLKPEHREPDAHREKLDTFRAEASAGRMVDFWTTADELTGKVATALVMEQMETPRPGWVRNPHTSPEVAEELARLSRRNAELEALILGTEQKITQLDVFVGKDEILWSMHDIDGSRLISVPIKIYNGGNFTIDKMLINSELVIPSWTSFKHKSSERFNLPPGETANIRLRFKSREVFPNLEKTEGMLEIKLTAYNLSAPVTEHISFIFPAI